MSDLFQNHPAKSGPVECLGQTFPSDEARREEFTAVALAAYSCSCEASSASAFGAARKSTTAPMTKMAMSWASRSALSGVSSDSQP